MREKRWNEAVHHAIQANDQSLAGTCARQLVVEGEFPLLFNWIDHLSLDVKRNNWPLRIAEDWANTLCYRYGDAIVILDELEQEVHLGSLIARQHQEISIVRAVNEIMADNRSYAFGVMERMQQGPIVDDVWLGEALNNLQAYKHLSLGEFERVCTQPEYLTTLRIMY